jgi:hypothetical protein
MPSGVLHRARNTAFGQGAQPSTRACLRSPSENDQFQGKLQATENIFGGLNQSAALGVILESDPAERQKHALPAN